MLAAVADEQAVDQALRAFAGEHRMNVVANQAAAQQNGVRGDVGAASLLNAQRGDVEGLGVFALEHVMRDDGALAGDQFGRGIGERDGTAERDVIFDDGDLACSSATIRLRGCVIVGASDAVETKSRWMGCSSDYALLDVNECAVGKESRVQCGEGVALGVQVAAEMGLERRRIRVDARRRDWRRLRPSAMRSMTVHERSDRRRRRAGTPRRTTSMHRSRSCSPRSSLPRDGTGSWRWRRRW